MSPRKKLFSILPLLALSLGCDRSDPSEPPSKETVGAATTEGSPSTGAGKEALPPSQISADDKKRAKEIAGEINLNRVDFSFSYKETKPENARALLWLAKTSKDSKLICAALAGMAKTWTADAERSSGEQTTDEYHALVLERLKSDDKLILEGALTAARNSVMWDKPNEKVLDQLVQIMEKHPEVYAKRLAALAFFHLDEAHPRFEQIALLAANSSDLPVVDAALEKLSGLIENRSKFHAPVLKALKAEEPRMKYLALKAFEDVGSSRAFVANRTQIVAHLAHETPMVRAQALRVIAEFGDARDLSLLPSGLKDSGQPEAIHYSATPDLRGQKPRPTLGSRYKTVAYYALDALIDITSKMGDDKFKELGTLNSVTDAQVADLAKEGLVYLEEKKATFKEKVQALGGPHQD